MVAEEQARRSSRPSVYRSSPRLSSGGSQTGLFATHPTGGSFEVVPPVDLAPQSLSPDSLEFRLEGSATADAFALANRSSCATGDLTVQFCSNDPASVTLTDKTPLASLGVRYALWPTVGPAPGCVEVPLG